MLKNKFRCFSTLKYIDIFFLKYLCFEKTNQYFYLLALSLKNITKILVNSIVHLAPGGEPAGAGTLRHAGHRLVVAVGVQLVAGLVDTLATCTSGVCQIFRYLVRNQAKS